MRLQIALQAEIGHDGRDDARLRQAAVLLPVVRNHGHQLVAVDQMAVLVDDQHAVGVAVERDADIGAQFADRRRERLGRGRAAHRG